MSNEEQEVIEPATQAAMPWVLAGPNKERWKAEGNRYSVEELRQMEREGGLTIGDWEPLTIE